MVDLDGLLQAVASDAPAGPNLEHDPAFMELERLAQGKPERQVGDTVIPAEEPNWNDVQERALSLFARTHDLRLVTLLSRAWLAQRGLPGLVDGVKLARRLVEEQWESVHPQLDPSDRNDPTFRANTLLALADRDGLLRQLRLAALVDSPRLGQFSLRDIEIARGTVPAPQDGAEHAGLAAIEAAAAESDGDALARVGEALAEVEALESAFQSRAGGAGPELEPLRTMLRAMRHALGEQLARRAEGASAAENGGAEPGEAAAAAGAGAPAARPGEINSREDAVRALERVIAYFEKHEPSSPIPLLLQRTKRLIPKNFLEIVRDLAPSGVSEIERIGGVDSQ